MSLPEHTHRLRTVRSHYRATPWIQPHDDEAPLLRSWQRSQDAGLREGDRVAFDLVSRAWLAELGDQYGAFVRQARPETERLAQAVQGSGCAVMLCSPRGTIIDRLCDEASTSAHLRQVSRVGINLAERCIGTNAPAIALAEGLPYLVGRDAHYCSNVRAFFCVAAPIDSPQGLRLGALDITAYDNVPNFDVFSLVLDAALAIENCLLQAPAGGMLVRLHPRADLLGTLMQGLLAVDGQGLVQGANRAAARLLAQPVVQLLGRPLAELVDLAPRRAGPSGRACAELRTLHGLTVQAQLDCTDGTLAAAAVPACDPAAGPAGAATLRQLEVATIQQTLAELGGNVSRAARRLGVSRNTIYRRLAENT